MYEHLPGICSALALGSPRAQAAEVPIFETEEVKVVRVNGSPEPTVDPRVLIVGRAYVCP